MGLHRSEAATDPIDTFIARWSESGAAERANFESFAYELCEVLGIERPLRVVLKRCLLQALRVLIDVLQGCNRDPFLLLVREQPHVLLRPIEV
jgi:hypothetical protein